MMRTMPDTIKRPDSSHIEGIPENTADNTGDQVRVSSNVNGPEPGDASQNDSKQKSE